MDIGFNINRGDIGSVLGTFVEKIDDGWFKVGGVKVKCYTSNSGPLKNEITWERHYDMNYTKIKDQLIKHEGLRLKPYKCTAGKMTIGVGRNLDDVGISEQEAMSMLENDIDKCVEDLREIFRQFDQLPENIQLVLVDMRFQLGPNRFKAFKAMIRAVEGHDWTEMIRQMKASAWYIQTTNRANNLIGMVKNAK